MTANTEGRIVSPAAMPDPAVIEAACRPGLRLAEIVKTLVDGYAERPALGQRARELVTDPSTGHTSAQLLARFDTIGYGDLWRRVTATATDSAGGTTTTNYSITVNPVIVVTPATLPADTINIAYNQTITASSDTGAITLTVSDVENAIAGLNVPSSGAGSLASSPRL